MNPKQAKINRAKVKLHKELAQERDHVCTGCGSHLMLSHSHLIPVGQRKDLELEKDNITYHCLGLPNYAGCHHIWEHGTTEEKKKLLDYEANMEYIRRVDPGYYNLIT